MTFDQTNKKHEDQEASKLFAWDHLEIDASIVAFSANAPVIDDRWVIVLDPRAIDANDMAIRMTVADLVHDNNEREDEEAE